MALALLKSKTTMGNPKNFRRQWFLLDADGKTLGRLASEIAKILMGKHKPTFTSHQDDGDGIIVINAAKIKVTGSKEAQIVYRYHTGSMSGMREVPYRTQLARNPTRIIEHAVRGMVPRSRLGKAQMKHFRAFAGDKHGMEAQQPIVVNI